MHPGVQWAICPPEPESDSLPTQQFLPHACDVHGTLSSPGDTQTLSTEIWWPRSQRLCPLPQWAA